MICADVGSFYYHLRFYSSDIWRTSVARSMNIMMTMAIYIVWCAADTDIIRPVASIRRRQSKRIGYRDTVSK